MSKRDFKLTVALLFAMLSLNTLFAGLDTCYTNWPATQEWLTLSNHIKWCYSSLTQRIAVLQGGTSVTPSQIKPSFIHPYDDYMRFANAIDTLAPKFLDLTECEQSGVYRWVYQYYFLNLGRNGYYSNQFPFWNPNSLHLAAFGREGWSTNTILKCWHGTENHELVREVHASITNLLLTLTSSSAFTEHRYSERRFQNSCAITDVYSAGCGANFNDAKNAQNSEWYTSGNYKAGTCKSWGNRTLQAVYAVGVSAIGSSNVVYGFRSEAKPVVNGIYAGIKSKPYWYLFCERHPHRRNEGVDAWYYYDFATGFIPFNSRDVNAGDHTIFVNNNTTFQNTTQYQGCYPFDGLSMSSTRRYQNPYIYRTLIAFQGYGSIITEHLYCTKTYWVLEWQFLTPPTKLPTNIVQNFDTDRDDIVDIGADIESLGPDTGTAVFDPELTEPHVILPVGTPPAWYQGLPVHAYLSAGTLTNLPFQYLVNGINDNDGPLTAYSLNTRIIESNYKINGGFIKKVAVLRPRGNVVVFQFNSSSEQAGHPIGVNTNRSYVLWDKTPGNHTDKQYDLHFESGIVHEFDSTGKLSKIRHANGLEVAMSSLPGYSVGWTDQNRVTGPNSVTAANARYHVTLNWVKDRIASIRYTPVNTTRTLTTTLSLDPANQRIASLSKSDLAQGNVGVSYSQGKITYTGNAAITRTETGGRPARTVTFTTSLPGSLSYQRQYKFDSLDRLYETIFLKDGEQAKTTAQYSNATGYHANTGLRKNRNVTYIEYPDKTRIDFTYWNATGYLKTRTYQGSGGTFMQSVAYPSNSIFMTERPTNIVLTFNNNTIAETRLSYVGAAKTTITQCNTNNGLRPVTVINTHTNGLQAGAPSSITSLLDTNAMTYSITGPKIEITALSSSSGDTSIEKVNAFGSVESSTFKQDGVMVQSTVALNVDDYGRPLRIQYLDNMINTLTYNGLFGPVSSSFSDGSQITHTLNAIGQVSSSLDEVSGITRAYRYDAVGNVTQMTASAAGDVYTESASFDAKGRIKTSATPMGVTSYAYADTATETTVTISFPDGRSMVHSVFKDGTHASLTGSAITPRHYTYRSEPSKFIARENLAPPGTAGAVQSVETTVNMIGQPLRMKRSGLADVVPAYDAKGRMQSYSVGNGVRYACSYDKRHGITDYGLDLNGNGQPDKNANDRLHTTDYFAQSGQVVSRLSSYAQSGSATATELVESRIATDGKSGSLEYLGRNNTFSQSDYTGPGRFTVNTVHADGVRETLTYDKWRLQKVERTDSSNNPIFKESYEYTGLGKLRKVDNTYSGCTTITYDSAHRPCIIDPPGALPITISYVPCTHRIDTIKKSDGSVIKSIYNVRGLPTRIYGSGLFDTGYGWNDKRQLTNIVAELSNTSCPNDGDHNFNITFSGNTRMSAAALYRDPETGLLKNKKLAQDNQSVSTRTYRDNGQPATFTDEQGRTATTSYDANSPDVANVNLPTGTPDISVQARNRLGQVTQIQQDTQLTRTYTIDGRLTSETQHNGAFSLINSYATTHDGLTSQTFTRNGTTTQTYQYDGASRVRTIQCGAIHVDYEYQPYSSVVGVVTVFNNDQCIYRKNLQWDKANGRIEKLEYKDGNTLIEQFDFGYENNTDLIKSIELRDGARWDYQYVNAGDRPHFLKQATYKPGSQGLFSKSQFDYQHDRMGNLLKYGRQVDLQVSPRSYSANTFNQHTERRWKSHYVIAGAASNRTSLLINDEIVVHVHTAGVFRAVMDASNQAHATNVQLDVISLIRVGDNEYKAGYDGALYIAKAEEVPVFDKTGNLQGDSRYAMRFDAQGRLVEVRTLHLAQNKAEVYAYDVQGRRNQKKVYTVSGTSSNMVRTHTFYYDGWNCVREEVSGDINETRRYTWALDISCLGHGRCEGRQGAGGVGGLVAIEINGARYFPVCDHLGTVHMLLDSNGAVVTRYFYSPYGELLGLDGLDLCPFKFQTKYQDKLTGYLYYGYRYADPATCKWIGREPLGELASLNLYAFCMNDPINHFDVLGLDDKIIFQENSCGGIDVLYVDTPTWLSKVFTLGIACKKDPVKIGTLHFRDGEPTGIVILDNGRYSTVPLVTKWIHSWDGWETFKTKICIEARESLNNDLISRNRVVHSTENIYNSSGLELYDPLNMDVDKLTADILGLDKIEELSKDLMWQYVTVTLSASTVAKITTGALTYTDDLNAAHRRNAIEYFRNNRGKLIQASKAGAVGNLGKRFPWPRGFRVVNPYTPDELIKFNCAADAEKIRSALGGGEIIHIRNPMGKLHQFLIGQVNLPQGGSVSGWFFHKAVIKDGRIYDKITGPAGMLIDDYKALFDCAADLLFEGL